MDVEAIEKRQRRRDALFLVIHRSDAAVDKRRRRRLAEIVADGAEHHGDLLRPRSSPSMRVRAWSMTCSVCTHTSPSGCHSGSCTQPTSACSSGNSFDDDAELQSRARTRSTAAAQRAASRTRPRCARPADRRAVSRGRSRASPRRARIRTARRTEPRAARAGCRPRTSRDRRRGARGAAMIARGRRTDRGIRPVSGSHAIALIVKSRRRAASSTVMPGSPDTSNPRWPRPDFDSRRGSETSMPPALKT